MEMETTIQGLGFRVWAVGFRVQDLNSGLKVQGLGEKYRIQGSSEACKLASLSPRFRF